MTFLALAKWALSGLTGLWSLICRYPWQIACIALLCLSWQLWERGDKYRDKLASTLAAQKVAGEAQAAVNHIPAAKSAAIASKSDAEAPAYYESVRTAADAHAVRLRNDGCPVSNADLPRADPTEPSLHGPDPAPDLVCRPSIEDKQLVYAAGRAAEMHQQTLDMIAEGVAVASDPQE